MPNEWFTQKSFVKEVLLKDFYNEKYSEIDFIRNAYECYVKTLRSMINYNTILIQNTVPYCLE